MVDSQNKTLSVVCTACNLHKVAKLIPGHNSDGGVGDVRRNDIYLRLRGCEGEGKRERERDRDRQTDREHRVRLFSVLCCVLVVLVLARFLLSSFHWSFLSLDTYSYLPTHLACSATMAFGYSLDMRVMFNGGFLKMFDRKVEQIRVLNCVHILRALTACT